MRTPAGQRSASGRGPRNDPGRRGPADRGRPGPRPGPDRPGPERGTGSDALPGEPAGAPRAPLGLGQRVAIGLGLALSLAALLLHARAYAFLTDDAFISFRYARNLSQGYGLIFNPGMERVEGYSNFLWVLVLAGLDRLGIRPEVAASWLSIAATIALWGLVVAFTLRRLPDRGREWLVLLPALFLAATRSVAVWSTSGLETRGFELLLVGGALRLVIEVEARLQGSARRPLAAWLFALATLTRPDGLLLSLAAFAAAGFYLARRGRLAAGRFLLELWPFVVLVGGHYVFRRLYYHEWLPNTYYAKVGGRLWWSSGLSYVAAFAIEYAAFLWLPLLVAGIARHEREGAGFFPLLCGALILPHALYVAAIGGDHFEYRPLDLYFPLVFLLLYAGARHLARTPARAAAVAAYAGLVLFGLWEIPYQSHRQFIGSYQPGFPGVEATSVVEAQRFLEPDRDPILRLPVLRVLASWHRDLVRHMTKFFVGVRQEEHRMFLATVIPEGKRLGRLVERGILPRDAYFAMSCVGAIPYYSKLSTLDMLGLTDAHVAHSAPKRVRVMAHDKMATLGYARERGVDVWAVEGVHSLCHVTSTCLLAAVRDAITEGGDYYAAAVGDGYYMVCLLPRGLESATRRMPRLEFEPIGNREFIDRFLSEGIAAYRDTLSRHPDDQESRLELAYLLLIDKQFGAAMELYRQLSRTMPDNPDLWENYAVCSDKLGDLPGAIAAAERAHALARSRGDPDRMGRIGSELEGYRRAAAARVNSRPPPG